MNAEKVKASMRIPPLSVPNMVGVFGIAAIALLIALRAGFRPVNLS